MREPIIPTRSHEQIAADNRTELDGWIEERTADLAARGMAPEAARRRALEEFGDADGATRYAARQDIAADRRLRFWFWIDAHGLAAVNDETAAVMRAMEGMRASASPTWASNGRVGSTSTTSSGVPRRRSRRRTRACGKPV